MCGLEDFLFHANFLYAMRVLWLSNIIFPELCNKLGITAPIFGGWMQSGAKALLERGAALGLAVFSFYRGETLQVVHDSHIRYDLVPEKNNKVVFVRCWCKAFSKSSQ